MYFYYMYYPNDDGVVKALVSTRLSASGLRGPAEYGLGRTGGDGLVGPLLLGIFVL